MNKRVCVFATFVILVGCAVQALTILFYIAPLLVLRGGSSFSAFTTNQLQGLVLVLFRLNSSAFNIYLVFFGLWCFLIGFLIFRSTFLPPRPRGAIGDLRFELDDLSVAAPRRPSVHTLHR